jgi:hypothetical protein
MDCQHTLLTFNSVVLSQQIFKDHRAFISEKCSLYRYSVKCSQGDLFILYSYVIRRQFHSKLQVSGTTTVFKDIVECLDATWHLKGQSHEKVGKMSVWGISLGPN